LIMPVGSPTINPDWERSARKGAKVIGLTPNLRTRGGKKERCDLQHL